MLITPTPRWLGYAWCVWSWRLMHDTLFVYWLVCDVTILCSSFLVDNSNAKMVGLCLMRMIMKVDASKSFRVLIGVWCKQNLTGRLIAPNRSFSLINYLYTTPLNEWLLRCTTAVLVFAKKVKQSYLHCVFLRSKALVFVHCDGCTNVTLGWNIILHVERRLWFSIALNRK